MTLESQRAEHLAQQLVRYEALFALLDDIQTLDDIEVIAWRIATRWKYFANATNWRLSVPDDGGFQVIDGFRGEARVADVPALSPWDEHHRKLRIPRLIRMADPWEGPAPPEHLIGKAITEIEVLPFARAGRCIGVLSVAARHQPFSELDKKFVRIFGSYFADRISDILLRRQATEALIDKATRDALTGLLNRGAIIEQLGNQLALSKRFGKPLGVILADDVRPEASLKQADDALYRSKADGRNRVTASDGRAARHGGNAD